MAFIAHIRQNPEQIQTIQQHSEAVSKITADILEPLGLSQCGKLCGMIHDMGKYTNEFQNYIKQANRGETVRRGSVNHTFAGVRFLLERYHKKEPKSEHTFHTVTCELLSIAIGSHHGYFDCLNNDGKNGFIHRVSYDNVKYQQAVKNFLQHGYTESFCDNIFEKAVEECQSYITKIQDIATYIPDENKETDCIYQNHVAFYMGCLARLLLSALMEGDRTDTAVFMTNRAQKNIQADESFWERELTHIEQKLSPFWTKPNRSPIEKARCDISDWCKQAAQKQSGCYRLSVPTGGGKTLCSLRYAVAHAKQHKKKRIFFISPLLSILEQNTAVIRSYLTEFAVVLEHHSDFVSVYEYEQQNDTRKLLLENWDTPIVVTTLVQFLQTLFSGKTSSIRRFWSLSDSVIILDEVQTVPRKMLSLFLCMVKFLTEFCHATVIFCSATQPSFEFLPYPPMETIPELIDIPKQTEKLFERTTFHDIGIQSISEIAAHAITYLKQKPNLLLICNKKDQVHQLYKQLYDKADFVFVLSANMCIQHRKQVLQQLQSTLSQQRNNETTILCISTQVIEAGVDISFSQVMRLLCGMDRMVQSAGRCNRNGEIDGMAPVYLVNCAGENLKHLKEFQEEKATMQKWLSAYQQPSIQKYYEWLYGDYAQQHVTYYPLQKQKSNTLFDWLGANQKNINGDTVYCFRQSFRSAGDEFHVIEEADGCAVLVPYQEGETYAQALLSGEIIEISKLKPYTITLYHAQQQTLLYNGGLVESDCGICILQKNHYDDVLGYLAECQPISFTEV